MKKLLRISVILLVALTAVACNNDNGNKQEKNVVIRMMAGGIEDDPGSQVYREAAEQFNKINPHIKVKYEYTAQPGRENLDPIELLQSEGSPDIVGLPTFRLKLAEEQDLLMDLTHLKENSEPGEWDIPQAILNMATIDGSLSIVPSSASPYAVLL
jgi:ABC-type glycerol-3-phosphate transport system substrate-binding protein